MNEQGAREAVAAMLSGNADDTPDRDHRCAVCGATTKLEGFLVNSLKIWNTNITTADDLIAPSMVEVACPGECNAKLYARHHDEVQREQAQTIALLAMLFAGNYNADSLRWLRMHGCKRQVDRVLAKEGTAKANAG